jgi:hypothetical protein
MRTAHPLRVAALSAIAALTVPAWAINVCTDATGRTVYQDQPCLAVAPVVANEPVAARVLTPALVSETVRRFGAAMMARDPTTAIRFFAPGFKSSLTNAKGTQSFTREEFIDMITQVLNAATSIETVARCGKADVQRGEGTIECELSERMVLMKRTQLGRSTERYRLIVSEGVVKFIEMNTREH